MKVAALLCALAVLQGGDDPIAREWFVRRAALFPDEHAAELVQAAAAEDWRARLDAFDALARAASSWTEDEPFDASCEALTLAGLVDPHPNVRAAALRVLAERGPLVVPDEEVTPRLFALADDVLPQVRHELVRALLRTGWPAGPALLAGLARDDDADVAEAARAALFAFGPEALAARLDVLGDLFDSGDEAALLEAFVSLSRSGLHEDLLDEAARLAAKLEDERRARSWRAIVEAVRYTRFGHGDAFRLVDGWIGSGDWEPARQRLLAEAAHRADSDLRLALLEALEDVALLRVGEPAKWNTHPGLSADLEARPGGGTTRVFHASFELGEALLWAAEPGEVLDLAFARELSPVALEVLFEGLLALDVAWDAERDLTWLRGDLPVHVRRAAIEAIGRAWSSAADPVARTLLEEALTDPDLANAKSAFQTLGSRVDEVQPALVAMHSRWLELEPEARIEFLSWLPPELELGPFRDDLVRMLADEAQRALVLEHLAAFRSDDALTEVVSDWLARDLATFEHARTDPAAARGLRILEFRVKAALDALARMQPDESVPTLLRVLERTSGTSEEIGKTAAACLARRPEGRSSLFAFLGRDVLRRVRIEAALGAARAPWEQLDETRRRLLHEALIRDYDEAARDLRTRLIDALAALPGDEAGRFLAERAVRSTVAREERVSLLHALHERAETGDARALETLRWTALEGDDIELVRTALALLGKLASPTVHAELEAWTLALASGELEGTPAEGRGAAVRATLREDLFEALARRPELLSETPIFEELWLRAPLEAAAETLRERFRDARGPSVAFRWRSELALARALAAVGRLRVALDGPPFWRLDGRLLLHLGGGLPGTETAGPSTPPGRDPARESGELFVRAGRGALLGEQRPDREALGRARAHLLGCAFRAGRWRAAERLALAVLCERRTGELPESAWLQSFGYRTATVDPLARLESLVFQARAQAALDAGLEPEARALALQARARLGDSRLARLAQERLEARLP